MPIERSALTQWWRDVTFVHWRVDPETVAHLLPSGTRPDLHDGHTYVGLVAFRLHPLGWPAVSNVRVFCETNVRLYTVDSRGRAGVLFLSMDASRWVPVLGARAAARLPYMWSKMDIHRQGNDITYTCQRRWPPNQDARSRLTVRVAERITQPSSLDHFLTARWGLHTSWFGRTTYLPNDHAPWDLRRAEVLQLDDGLVAAAGVTAPGEPVSVLYSSGVQARFGLPLR